MRATRAREGEERKRAPPARLALLRAATRVFSERFSLISIEMAGKTRRMSYLDAAQTDRDMQETRRALQKLRLRGLPRVLLKRERLSFVVYAHMKAAAFPVSLPCPSTQLPRPDTSNSPRLPYPAGPAKPCHGKPEVSAADAGEKRSSGPQQ
jgi:hypothetical protein